jgi:hypothetical protein
MLRVLPWNEYKVRCIDVHPWEGNSRPIIGYKLSLQRFERIHPDFCAVALQYARVFGNDLSYCHAITFNLYPTNVENWANS